MLCLNGICTVSELHEKRSAAKVVTFTQTKEGTSSAIKPVHPGVFLEIEIEAFKSESYNTRDFKWYNSQTKEGLIACGGTPPGLYVVNFKFTVENPD
jgi:hypothetical protein